MHGKDKYSIDLEDLLKEKIKVWPRNSTFVAVDVLHKLLILNPSNKVRSEIRTKRKNKRATRIEKLLE